MTLVDWGQETHSVNGPRYAGESWSLVVDYAVDAVKCGVDAIDYLDGVAGRCLGDRDCDVLRDGDPG